MVVREPDGEEQAAVRSRAEITSARAYAAGGRARQMRATARTAFDTARAMRVANRQRLQAARAHRPPPREGAVLPLPDRDSETSGPGATAAPAAPDTPTDAGDEA